MSPTRSISPCRHRGSMTRRSQHAPDEHILMPLSRSAIEVMAGLYWDIGEGKTPR